MASPFSATVLRRAFVDVCRGYSETVYAGKPLYIRHLSHVDHVGYDLVQERFEVEARTKGATPEAVRLAQLHKDGRWSEAKEREIAVQRDAITRFEDTIRNTPQPSVAQSLTQQMEGERAKLTTMLVEKAELLGMTAEVWAQRMLNDHYVMSNLFADKGLCNPLFPEVAFEDMDDSTVEGVLAVYHKAIEPCSDAVLRQLAVAEFFTSYYNLCADRADAFYGRAVCEMTYYQIRLMSIARYYKAILEGVDLTKIEASYRNDPDAIERLYTAQRSAKQMEAEGKLPGNMTTSDMEQTGLKGQYATVDRAESAMDIVKRLSRGGRPG